MTAQIAQIERKKPTAATILFGPEETSGKILVASILRDAHTKGESISQIVESVFTDNELLQSLCEDYEFCSLVVQALVAELHSESQAVIRAIGEHFKSPKCKIFPLGIVLGLFRGIKMYIDCEHEYRNEYREGLTQTLPIFILGPYMFENKSGGDDEAKQKGKLSEVISEYFKTTNERDLLNLMVETRDLITLIYEKAHGPERRETLGIFGETLMNELYFKVFRDMSTRQRSTALKLEWDEQVVVDGK